ncbi:ependymin-like [Pelmatolapia mariae]|uniref:ependymin-like n=1 Tax=Pelmatolapia mariae TaxID=158779 RepID=UPI003211E6C4
MVLSQKRVECPLRVGDEFLSQVEKFKYLGILFASDGRREPEIDRRIVVPELLSGGLTAMTGDGLISSTGLITYDALGQRMRVKNFGIGDNQDFALDQLMLFSEGVYYKSNWKTLSCKKMKLDSSFIPMQVPPDAKLMVQVFMGSSSSWGMGVLTNTWHLFDCLYPVSFTSYTPQSGWLTVSTFNWIIGISNPMDFIPPDFCVDSKLEETKTPHSFFTAVESLAMKTKRDK